MKTRLPILLLSLFLAGALNAETKPVLAILPFTGASGNDGETIALMLSYSPKITAAFTAAPLSREIAGRLADDPGFQRFGVTDSDILAGWGQELHADYVLTGHIHTFGDHYMIRTGMVETATYRQIAGAYREYTNSEELETLLPALAKDLTDAAGQDTSTLPLLGVLPLSIADGVNPEEAAVLDGMLITEIINTRTYALLPRLTSGTAPEESAGIAPYVLVRSAEKQGRAAEFQAVIAQAGDETLIAAGRSRYRNAATGLKSVLELSYTLTGVRSTAEPIRTPDSAVYAAAYSPDGKRIVSGSGDKNLYIWDAENGRILRALTGHNGSVYAAAYSPDGKRIVSGSGDKNLYIWDAENGRFLRALIGHYGYVYAAAYSPDGQRIVSASGDGTLRIWDAETGAELAILIGHRDWVHAAAYSPDGRYIVSGSEDKTLRVWDAETGAELRTLSGHTDYVKAVAYSPDGKHIVSGSDDGTLRVWDAETGAELRTLLGHIGTVLTLGYSPDGGSIVSGSGDGTLRIWDTLTGTEIGAIPGHSDWVRAAAYNPDSRRILSASDDKTLKIWDIETGRLLHSLPEIAP